MREASSGPGIPQHQRDWFNWAMRISLAQMRKGIICEENAAGRHPGEIDTTKEIPVPVSTTNASPEVVGGNAKKNSKIARENEHVNPCWHHHRQADLARRTEFIWTVYGIRPILDRLFGSMRKNGKGFQPPRMTWGRVIVDAVDPVSAYAAGVRWTVIVFGAKLIHTGGEIIINVTPSPGRRRNVWCN